MKNKLIVETALRAVITEPNDCHDQTIAQYFSPDYRQVADGNELNYDDFVKHIKRLHQVLQYATITVVAIVEEQETVFTHHHVFASKHDGTRIHTQVFAQFTLKHGKIVQCDELTRLIVGDQQDHDLGYRR
ncbi:nuclear transport factor 2 family protein [Orbus sturtevantii]|uniref:nuclear transport factor 2 family protein n=1 Tax=Orbus sturtevantii TaxID=3074109 RepID=UPI00370D34F3